MNRGRESARVRCSSIVATPKRVGRIVLENLAPQGLHETVGITVGANEPDRMSQANITPAAAPIMLSSKLRIWEGRSNTAWTTLKIAVAAPIPPPA